MKEEKDKIPFLCKIGFHNWSKWKVYKKDIPSKIYFANCWVLHRECIDCNNVQFKESPYFG